MCGANAASDVLEIRIRENPYGRKDEGGFPTRNGNQERQSLGDSQLTKASAYCMEQSDISTRSSMGMISVGQVLAQSPVVDNGTRARRRVSSGEPKTPEVARPICGTRDAGSRRRRPSRTHARTQDPEEQSKKYHEYSISPHEHRCQYHEPKKSKTHAVTSGWYTDAGTRSRDEVSYVQLRRSPYRTAHTKLGSRPSRSTKQ
ncbi:hypothetical protein EDB85DRAFT_1887551 [Lactarius pseudohatsudake]|nr:hypothetical protein EDB85DRAFT_1887551 [Lactarius pseudohatsudake]